MKRLHTIPTYLRITLVIFWMAGIFILSSIPSLQSGLPSVFDLVFRKLAHIIEYAILTWLVWFAVAEAKLFTTTKILLAVVIALAYAVGDEFHQTLVPGRHGAPTDVMIDSIGIIVMAVVLRLRA